MYRYEVTDLVRSDIEGLVGKTVFYADQSKWYINDINRDVVIQYHDAAADVIKSETLDQICQSLYTTDFDAQSTKSSYSEVSQIEFSTTQKVYVDKGTHSFDTVVSHNWIDNTTWPSTSDSEWIVEPSAMTKVMYVPKAEVQFTHDVKLKSATTPGELYFDIWVFNPLFDSGQTVDADDDTFIPGVSSGNPLRFLYKRNSFKSLKEVFDFGNDHYSMNAVVDGLPSGVTTVRFDYDQKIELRGDQGAQIRFSLKDDSPMEGGTNSFCTVSLVIREDDL